MIKYKNRFDTSISFATYSKPGSFVARMASKNSILWCHADYLGVFENNKAEMKNFFEEIYYDYFSKIVFVSKKARQTFLDVFPMQKNTFYCNNLIDYKKIYKLTEDEIKLKYDKSKVTFLNVGRHDEKQKKLTRIIKAAKLLKDHKYKFRIIFVGSGEDTEMYKKLTKKYNLQNNIIFVGNTDNPYPYYKIANCIVMSSDYEGYPVVFLESYLLNRPIITTDVSDFEEIVNKRGIVVQKNVKSLYKGMKNFIENGFNIKQQFDIMSFNSEIENTLEKIL